MKYCYLLYKVDYVYERHELIAACTTFELAVNEAKKRGLTPDGVDTHIEKWVVVGE